MEPSSTLVENIFYYDSSDSVFKYGDIEIENGKIRKIEEKDPVHPENNFLAPGFINTHAHIAMSRFRGKLDDVNLEKFLERTFRLDSGRSREDILHSSICGIYEHESGQDFWAVSAQGRARARRGRGHRDLGPAEESEVWCGDVAPAHGLQFV